MISQNFQKRINRQLQKFFAEKRAQAAKVDARITSLIDQITDVTLRGGDRQRPFFCYLGYQVAKNVIPAILRRAQDGPRRAQSSCELCRTKAGIRILDQVENDNLENIMPALLALELFHTFALIHDDLMDAAELRRGGRTIHAYFTQNSRPSFDSVGLRTKQSHTKNAPAWQKQVRSGTSLAILAGDLCAQWAQELFDKLIRSHLEQGETFVKAQALFNQLREEVMYGQISDTWGMQGKTFEAIRQMYRQKSGNYSVAKPLVLGAVLGRAAENLTKKLTKYGEAVGLAFQLKDDFLDMFGDEKETGKSGGSDVREGKWTLLVALIHQELDAKNRKKLARLLHTKNATPQNIAWIKQQIIITGVKAQMEKEMQNLVVRAKEAICGLPESSRLKLTQIADFIIERSN